jgi:hypothetical protein
MTAAEALFQFCAQWGKFLPLLDGKMLTPLSQSDTTGFRQHVRLVTVTSNGMRYIIEAIDSVQLLHYTKILFPDSAEVAEPENPGLLPCRSGEIVFHVRNQHDGNDDISVAQLVVQCTQLSNPFKVALSANTLRSRSSHLH